MTVPNDVVTGELITAATMNAILAELRKIPQAGEVTMTSAGATVVTQAVTFAKPFTTLPVVTVNPSNVADPSRVHVNATSVTVNGFTIRLTYDTSGANLAVSWAATPKTQ